MLHQFIKQTIEKQLAKKINWVITNNKNGERPLHNKKIAFKVQPIQLTISIKFTDEIIVTINDLENTDLYVETNVKTIKKMHHEFDITQLIKDEEIKLTGDAMLLQELASWQKELDVDWLEPLESRIGATLTYQIQQIATNIISLLINLKKTKQSQWDNFMKYEFNYQNKTKNTD